MDAKQACDKLNGFNFQSRYLVGTFINRRSLFATNILLLTFVSVVLYHQPDKMAKSKENMDARRESLARLKQQHGID